jgi:hypothetical protein
VRSEATPEPRRHLALKDLGTWDNLSGPDPMPRGWRLSYYSRIAEASGSAPAPEHAGGVSLQVSPCGPGRADLVRKMNQFAKEHFRRDAAFLFSH